MILGEFFVYDMEVILVVGVEVGRWYDYVIGVFEFLNGCEGVVVVC